MAQRIEPARGLNPLIGRMRRSTRIQSNRGQTTMIRKMSLVLAATAALAAVALAPTSASAWGRGGWGWGGVGIGLGVGLVGSAIVANTCVQRRVVNTYYGPVVRWVNVCY
jgi:hypothetical protein